MFRPELRLAIEKGIKTQTRRLIKPQPFMRDGVWRWQPKKGIDINLTDHSDSAIPFARFQVGEVVYIKEALRRDGGLMDCCYDDENMTPVFRNGNFGEFVKWQWKGYKLSPMFMPAWAARYFIRITDVRPERLQEITLADIKSEGTPAHPEALNYRDDFYQRRKDFEWLWDSINPKYPFSSNPFVWVAEFGRVKK